MEKQELTDLEKLVLDGIMSEEKNSQNIYHFGFLGTSYDYSSAFLDTLSIIQESPRVVERVAEEILLRPGGSIIYDIAVKNLGYTIVLLRGLGKTTSEIIEKSSTILKEKARREGRYRAIDLYFNFYLDSRYDIDSSAITQSVTSLLKDRNKQEFLPAREDFQKISQGVRTSLFTLISVDTIRDIIKDAKNDLNGITEYKARVIKKALENFSSYREKIDSDSLYIKLLQRREKDMVSFNWADRYLEAAKAVLDDLSKLKLNLAQQCTPLYTEVMGLIKRYKEVRFFPVNEMIGYITEYFTEKLNLPNELSSEKQEALLLEKITNQFKLKPE